MQVERFVLLKRILRRVDQLRHDSDSSFVVGKRQISGDQFSHAEILIGRGLNHAETFYVSGQFPLENGESALLTQRGAVYRIRVILYIQVSYIHFFLSNGVVETGF